MTEVKRQSTSHSFSHALGVFVISLIPFIFAAGLPIQAVCNIGVGRLLGHPLWGVSVSYSLAAILAFFLIFKKNETNPRPLGEGFLELGSKVRSGAFEWVALFPAVLGVFFVASAVFVPSLIGFGPFFTAVVCGQIGMSLIVDYTGIIWSPKKGVSIPQVVGAVLVIFGTILFQYDAFTKAGAVGAGVFVGLLVVGVGAGAALVVQATLNRRLGSSLGTPWRAIWFNFTSAAILVTIAALIFHPSPSTETTEVSDTWKFFGGIFGFFIVSVMVIVPTYIGFVFTFSMQVLGQLVSSVLVDLFVAPPLLGGDAKPFSALRGGGLAVAVLGVLVGMFAEVLVSFLGRCRGGKRRDTDNGEKKVGDAGARDGNQDNQFVTASERENTQAGGGGDSARVSLSEALQNVGGQLSAMEEGEGRQGEGELWEVQLEAK
uniref:EamA domain-containing protein n=1 Tax=Chromera velia CCMP2878 TaxID=1169474 RepID=A0A0G4HAC9_9ALVE|eukprot:Cvel_6033.t1-p1 / transcript=Cvel_6033.t1 / gene=Cvel_6033 / organism=Chromera_velia_CCMP2878 / gene_product=hypothetical protein / transcript_product=hypothetical protein / location=Cvel_scaffold289:80243-81532(+) / protein_length=430 / sequence_SO=supercontig / SO=protein_coding / is_pseudo=false